MISKNIFPEIIKGKKGKNEAKESGCCFRSCGGKPCIQQSQNDSQNLINKVLRKIK
jgi:hypothetical protein